MKPARLVSCFPALVATSEEPVDRDTALSRPRLMGFSLSVMVWASGHTAASLCDLCT
jgi:hypothetical protein